MIRTPTWYEKVFRRGGRRYLAIISNDNNDVEPCFYIKVWNITANKKVRDWSTFSDIVIEGNQTNQFGQVLDSWIDFSAYGSNGVCHPTMVGAVRALERFMGGI